MITLTNMSVYILIIFALSIPQWTEAQSKDFKSQMGLVKYLVSQGHIKSEIVADVMSRVDRKYYIPENPYQDVVTVFPHTGIIEEPPRMIAFVLETLKDYLIEQNKALHIGSGSGYLTACMGLMLGPYGLAVGLENSTKAVEYSRIFFAKDEYLKLRKIQVRYETGALDYAFSECSTYQAIYVTPAIPEVADPFIHQLDIVGRLLLFRSDKTGPINKIWRYDKHRNFNTTHHAIWGNFTVYRKIPKYTGPTSKEDMYYLSSEIEDPNETPEYCSLEKKIKKIPLPE